MPGVSGACYEFECASATHAVRTTGKALVKLRVLTLIVVEMTSSETSSIEVEEETQKRCTHCFQELCEMTDPRLLPCQHIVCLTCLQEDWKLDKLECRACGYVNPVERVTLP